MARIDKIDPVDGTWRAPLAANRTGSATPVGVGLDSSGRVVPGAGQTGVVGVLCDPNTREAGDKVDVLKDAELVEFAGVAGTKYFANDTTGVISTTSGAGTTYVGHTVEASRFIVGAGR